MAICTAGPGLAGFRSDAALSLAGDVNVALFGKLAPLTTAMVQGVIDGATCLLIYLIAKAIDRRFAVPAAVAAAIDPTQIVLSGIIYTDTLFVFFVAMFLAGAAYWLRNRSWQAALATGAGLGGAGLVRILVAPWVPAMLLVLLAAAYFTRRLRPQLVAQVAAMAAIFALCIAPILARNATQYGSWALTNQGGTHLALWIVPLVQEAKNGTPWEHGTAKMEKRVRERFPQKAANPFVESQHYAVVGREELAKLGIAAIVKAWVIGAAINIAAPAIIISPPIARLPRSGFYATTGQTVFDKICNYLFHSDNAIYAWALLIGVAGVGDHSVHPAVGYSCSPDRHTSSVVVLLLLWCGFILAIYGPIASPKYRLPIEPVLCVLTGAGQSLLRGGGSSRPA